jgi:hypothetical protein
MTVEEMRRGISMMRELQDAVVRFDKPFGA